MKIHKKAKDLLMNANKNRTHGNFSNHYIAYNVSKCITTNNTNHK